jgi:hypothetical protein
MQTLNTTKKKQLITHKKSNIPEAGWNPVLVQINFSPALVGK